MLLSFHCRRNDLPLEARVATLEVARLKRRYTQLTKINAGRSESARSPADRRMKWVRGVGQALVLFYPADCLGLRRETGGSLRESAATEQFDRKTCVGALNDLIGCV